MTREDLQRTIVEALAGVAPDTDPAALAPDADLREALDIDSVDFLNFVIALHDRLGVDVPETDYARLATIGSAVDYLLAKLAHPAGQGA
jgi:acyl carrier protein